MIVLISQHSSFEREEYLRDQPSLSGTDNTSSLLQHDDSGIGESSPSSESSVPDKLDRGGVIPDSQSLPDSSTYVPSSNTSTGSRSSTQAQIRSRVVIASSWKTSTNSSNIHPVSSYSPTQESSDPIEDFSDPSPEGSQSFGAHTSRSRSLPSGALPRTSGRNQTRPTQILANTPNRSAVLHGELIRTAPELSTDCVVRSSVTEVPSSSELYTQTRASLGIFDITHPHSQGEIQVLSGYQPVEGQISRVSSTENRAGAQVDFHQTHISQETHKSIPSVGKTPMSVHS